MEQKLKIHHCFNCGEETEDYDYLPNDRRIYICGSNECSKEYRLACREIESETKQRADDDDYSRYY